MRKEPEISILFDVPEHGISKFESLDFVRIPVSQFCKAYDYTWCNQLHDNMQQLQDSDYEFLSDELFERIGLVYMPGIGFSAIALTPLKEGFRIPIAEVTGIKDLEDANQFLALHGRQEKQKRKCNFSNFILHAPTRGSTFYKIPMDNAEYVTAAFHVTMVDDGSKTAVFLETMYDVKQFQLLTRDYGLKYWLSMQRFPVLFDSISQQPQQVEHFVTNKQSIFIVYMALKKLIACDFYGVIFGSAELDEKTPSQLMEALTCVQHVVHALILCEASDIDEMKKIDMMPQSGLFSEEYETTMHQCLMNGVMNFLMFFGDPRQTLMLLEIDIFKKFMREIKKRGYKGQYDFLEKNNIKFDLYGGLFEQYQKGMLDNIMQPLMPKAGLYKLFSDYMCHINAQDNYALIMLELVCCYQRYTQSRLQSILMLSKAHNLEWKYHAQSYLFHITGEKTQIDQLKKSLEAAKIPHMLGKVRDKEGFYSIQIIKNPPQFSIYNSKRVQKIDCSKKSSSTTVWPNTHRVRLLDSYSGKPTEQGEMMDGRFRPAYF